MPTSVQTYEAELLEPTNRKVGRPKKITAEVLQKLEEAYSNHATHVQASFIAGIAVSTLYDYIEAHPEFKLRIEALKGNIAYNAKKTIAKAVNRDPHLALDVVSRLEKAEWSVRNELTGADGSQITFKVVPDDPTTP